MHPPLFSRTRILLFSLSLLPFSEGISQMKPPKFEPLVIDDAVEIGYGIAIGDVDGDGAADILLADKRQISWYRSPNWEKGALARNLTLRDNVCLTAADLDGDGKVEVAVGAQWNPGETTDKAQSGAVFYLKRPADANGPWKPVPLYHDPTTHRMRWVPGGDGGHELIVLPLHGIGNKDGAGENFVNVRSYRVDPAAAGDEAVWTHEVLGAKLHVTHNLDHRDGYLYIGGAEGIVREKIGERESTLLISPENSTPPTRGVGEIAKGTNFIATIEPFHGNDLAVYRESAEGKWTRTLLTDTFNQGHALGVGDFNGDGREDIVAGWREPDAEGHVGIKLFLQKEDGSWEQGAWVANDFVATEDLKVVDIDGDGRPDIVAAGRSSKNLVIFRNLGE
jgi:hypothetical protein